MSYESLKILTVFTLDGKEVIKKIEKATGHHIDPFANGDIQDSHAIMNIKVNSIVFDDQFEEAEYDLFCKNGEGYTPSIIKYFLCLEYKQARLPEGNYQVEFYR